MTMSKRTIALLRRANQHYKELYDDGKGGTIQTPSILHHPECKCGPCATKDPWFKQKQLETINATGSGLGAMRLIVVGGPRLGKSTLARQYRELGIPTFCGDPVEMVKDREPFVTYLPSGLEWSEGSAYIAEHWFARPGPWVCEGQIMARALRKWSRPEMPADRIIVLQNAPHIETTSGQASMIKAVDTVWREIEHRFRAIAHVVT